MKLISKLRSAAIYNLENTYVVFNASSVTFFTAEEEIQTRKFVNPEVTNSEIQESQTDVETFAKYFQVP